MIDPGLLTEEECAALTARVLELVATSHAQVEIEGLARSTGEFARGDTHLSSDIRSSSASLLVQASGRQALARTNQLDDEGLRSLVATTEALAHENRTPADLELLPPQTYPRAPEVYFESTVVAMAADDQAALVHATTRAAESEGLVAAGDMNLEARVRAVRNTNGLFGFTSQTYGEFSVTARSEDRRGSGWAWSGFEDWERVDTSGVIARAVGLGGRSAEPVAIEPGRYTVVLEPAAVAALIHPIIGMPTQSWNAWWADNGSGPFAKEPRGTNKIGLQMMDRRLGMVSDPWDSERPAVPITRDWTPITERVAWFDNGILRNLAYSPDYARQMGRDPIINPGGVRLFAEGPSETLEGMIAAIRRGVWVNRLSAVGVLDDRTLVLTGTTRDGTFLIENGKITRPIRNFRFMESPFFVFNQVEAWGEPERASRAVVAPRLMVRDFNFSSLTDAI